MGIVRLSGHSVTAQKKKDLATIMHMMQDRKAFNFHFPFFGFWVFFCLGGGRVWLRGVVGSTKWKKAARKKYLGIASFFNV